MANNNSHIIVVKIGTSTLVGVNGSLNLAFLQDLAKQLAALKARGWKPIVVTSGAIGCGLERLGIPERPSDMPTLQAAASVGQNILMSSYAKVCDEVGLTTSVILITRQTTRDRSAYLHARDTLDRLLELDVIPIINENDTVSVEQIRFGDNDTLAALVSCLVGAELCAIFSDIEGLFAQNPNIDPDAPLISHVSRITPEIMAIAGGAGSKMGSGGMITKIRSARVLMTAGIDMVICYGKKPHALERIVAGEEVGTRFSAHEIHHDITPKKLWIALGDTPKGVVVVDAGAKRALIDAGSSLLAVGITSVRGAFKPGDSIDIKDDADVTIARGRAGASSSEVELACGKTQAEIKQNELFVNLAQHPVVHRDELVVFE